MLPLYEGIALIQEKQAVVLDLGRDYTKCGFTGEPSPRCIIPSEFWCPTRKCMKRVHDYETEEELYENIVHMLHLLYFRHILVNPKERKVIVVESLLTPTVFREALARALFRQYEAPGAVWADAARLCAVALAAPVVLVVDFGSRDVEVTAVVHGSPILNALQTQPLGAGAVRRALAARLRRDNPLADHALTDEVVDDIKVKCCYVCPPSRAAGGPGVPPAAGARAALGGSALQVSGEAREMSAEVMFERDGDMNSVPDAILQCIMKCPIDARRPLAENILLTGGGALLPGLAHRLQHELRGLLGAEPYSSRLSLPELKFHSPPGARAHCAWLGAALTAADALASRALARDVYTRRPRLRDWVCLADNKPERCNI